MGERSSWEVLSLHLKVHITESPSTGRAVGSAGGERCGRGQQGEGGRGAGAEVLLSMPL